jgi:hypothetical protein
MRLYAMGPPTTAAENNFRIYEKPRKGRREKREGETVVLSQSRNSVKSERPHIRPPKLGKSPVWQIEGRIQWSSGKRVEHR